MKRCTPAIGRYTRNGIKWLYGANTRSQGHIDVAGLNPKAGLSGRRAKPFPVTGITGFNGIDWMEYPRESLKRLFGAYTQSQGHYRQQQGATAKQSPPQAIDTRSK